MTTLSSMLQQGEQLKHLKCEARGCSQKRQGMAPLCNAHLIRKARYGSPHGNAIPSSQYAKELKEVKAFFEARPGHPAIASALDFLGRWMADAGRQKEGLVGQPLFIRLHAVCIPPMDILTELCAVWLYADRNPIALPDDDRLTFALARNCVRLAGFRRKNYGGNVSQLHPRPAQLKATGERLRQTLSRFYVNLGHALKAQADQVQADKQQLATPFI